MLGQRRDTSGYEGGPKSTHILKAFPSDQCLDPNLVALRCLRMERAMGIEPTRAVLSELKNKRFGAMANPKCD